MKFMNDVRSELRIINIIQNMEHYNRSLQIVHS